MEEITTRLGGGHTGEVMDDEESEEHVGNHDP